MLDFEPAVLVHDRLFLMTNTLTANDKKLIKYFQYIHDLEQAHSALIFLSDIDADQYQDKKVVIWMMRGHREVSDGGRSRCDACGTRVGGESGRAAAASLS